MKNIKTHTGLLIHKEQTRRVRLHETPAAWCHTRRECYSKTTGRRCGSPDSKRTARAVLTGMCYSAGSAMRHGSSSLTRLTG
ncbi:hypothetical protein, partial [Escherichia coli]|uniref:hypothetical protein n=1 Tax=Escherichia coli TaxID=562 RepID=UPI0030F3B83F